MKKYYFFAFIWIFMFFAVGRVAAENLDPIVDEDLLTPETIEQLKTSGEQIKKFLEGDVTIYLQVGGCSGCRGGCTIKTGYRVDGNNIYIQAKAEHCSCEGNCEAYWPGFGAIKISGLPPGDYTVYHPQGMDPRIEIHDKDFLSEHPAEPNLMEE